MKPRTLDRGKLHLQKHFKPLHRLPLLQDRPRADRG